MYKTIRFEIALCTHTKDKAQRKKWEEYRKGKVKTMCFYFFGWGVGVGCVASGIGQRFWGSPSSSWSSTDLQGAVIMTIIIMEWLGVQFHAQIWIMHIRDAVYIIYPFSTNQSQSTKMVREMLVTSTWNILMINIKGYLPDTRRWNSSQIEH